MDDLCLLKDKVDNNLGWLRLMGGEPLLHPQIEECLIKIRSLFPKTDIRLITNGILLKSMSDEFYSACVECDIKINITDYKIFDTKETIQNLRERGIVVSLYKSNTYWKYQHIRLTDSHIDCLSHCVMKSMCNNYRDGKIYLCPYIAYIDIFNKHFDKNIQLTDSDSVDLRYVNSLDDLKKQIEDLHPNFCFQYCNCYDKQHPKKGEWEKTKKDINEFCLVEK